MSPAKNPKWTTGRILISFIGIFTALSPYIADWNKTHIYNPTWPPHAKFHNAQTMVLGALLGMLTLYCLWYRKGMDELNKTKEATCLASLYWVSQFPALLFPGSKLTDATSLKGPVVLGIELNQIIMDIVFVMPLLIVGYYLEAKRLKKVHVNVSQNRGL